MRFLFVVLVGCFAMAEGHAGRLIFDGQFVEGGLVVGLAEPGAKVLFDGKPVRVSAEGYFVLGFHREAKEQTTVTVTYQDGTEGKETFKIEQREYEIQRIDGLPANKVNPSAEELKRIRAETKLIKQARKLDDVRTDFRSGFIWPAIGPISGVYGSQRVLNGEPRRPHYGVDIALPTGSPAKAPAAGIITLVHDDMFFTGGTLVIDHGHGLTSWFLHLSEVLVKKGQKVKQGEVIAKIGATGRVTGAHLDWRMNLFEKRIDPQLLVGPMPQTKPESEQANGG